MTNWTAKILGVAAASLVMTDEAQNTPIEAYREISALPSVPWLRNTAWGAAKAVEDFNKDASSKNLKISQANVNEFRLALAHFRESYPSAWEAMKPKAEKFLDELEKFAKTGSKSGDILVADIKKCRELGLGEKAPETPKIER